MTRMTSHSSSNPEALKVLFIASEAEPLVKVGGLGDVAGSLPPALMDLTPQEIRGRRLDVRLVIPFHGVIHQKLKNPELIANFEILRKGQPVSVQVFYYLQGKVPTYLIAGQPIPLDGSIYSQDNRIDAEKYIFFSLAALELYKHIDWIPDILHANDWHTACAVYGLALKRPVDKQLAMVRSVLTVHNLPFLGAQAGDILAAYGLPASQDPQLPEWARTMPMPLGLQSADHIVAVSPTYAKEILSVEFGSGLQNFLKTRKKAISGIMNGLDQVSWDPVNDAYIPACFKDGDVSPRPLNKKTLLSNFSLPEKSGVPLLIMVTRMDRQKGVDLAIAALKDNTRLPWQAIFLGTGDPVLENACRQLEADLPERFRAALRFDNKLAHTLYAGADILLMPSRYEPCGLSQMIAMRYGCIPLARSTGGLHDSIHDDQNHTLSTGFLFKRPTSLALAQALKRAIQGFQDQATWQSMQLRGMKQDFSWHQSAVAYTDLYIRLREKLT
jgi:starch synthase